MMNKEAYRWVQLICPVCETPPTELLGRRGGSAHRQKLGVECEVWRCGKCGLIFPNPMPIPINGVAQHYAMAPDTYFHNHDREEKDTTSSGLLGTAEEIVGGKGVLLDIGAGRGELLKAAKREGWRAIGIEPSPVFADYARNYSGAEIKSEALENCAFSAGSFDAVVLSGVLEHLYNPDETIREISRLLRRGGALFVDVPNENGIYFRVGNIYERLRSRDWVVNLAPTFSPFHVFGFGPRSLRAILKKHNLEPTRWRIYGGRAMIPSRSGVVGFIEQQAARVVTAISNMGSLGTYIETWAIKK